MRKNKRACKVSLTLTTLSTKARSVPSSTQGRRCDSQTADVKHDMKKEMDGGQERTKANVDVDDQGGENGVQETEGDKLAEARNEHRDD